MGSLFALLLFVLYSGRYSNYGTNLIEACFANPAGQIYPWDWLLKMMLSIGCLNS